MSVSTHVRNMHVLTSARKSVFLRFFGLSLFMFRCLPLHFLIPPFLDYLQLLYLYPIQKLPILLLVSEERNTGKSTFLNFLKAIF